MIKRSLYSLLLVFFSILILPFAMIIAAIRMAVDGSIIIYAVVNAYILGHDVKTAIADLKDIYKW